jgi:hypothetical protein
MYDYPLASVHADPRMGIMPYPMTVKLRADLRTERENMGAARGRLIEVRGYQSIRCQDGDHAPGGCHNDGSGCLCACHDPEIALQVRDATGEIVVQEEEGS